MLAILLRHFGFIAPKHFKLFVFPMLRFWAHTDECYSRNKLEIYVFIPAIQPLPYNLDTSRLMHITYSRHFLFGCNFVMANRVYRLFLPICYTGHFKRININKTWPDKHWCLFLFLNGLNFNIFQLSCATFDIIFNLLKAVNIWYM